MNVETKVFEVLEEAYEFTISAAYHANANLVEQLINFERKNLTPILDEINDAEGVARI